MVCACLLSHLVVANSFAIPLTVACQAPLSMEFPRQEHWTGLPFPPPGDLPDPGMEPESLRSPALASRFLTTSTSWEVNQLHMITKIKVILLYINR